MKDGSKIALLSAIIVRRPGAKIERGNYRTLGPNVPPGPLNWRDEQSGILARAVTAYLEHSISGRLTQDQIDLLGDYLDHYIHAPCWDANGFADELADLRRKSEVIDSLADIHEFISLAMEVGIDPL